MEKVLLIGVSGYIGRHVAKELVRKGYTPICPLRKNYPELKKELNLTNESAPLCDLSKLESIEQVLQLHPDLVAVISCIASRTGGVKESWDVDYRLNENLLTAIKGRKAIKFIFLSAICVQKPKLNFQFAKLAFEKSLQGSGLDHTIIRPTAYFKSLAGQIERIKKGKRFIVFDNGKLSSTKPISERDLSTFLVETINSPSSRNKILSIGGPGPDLTQKDMGKILFDLVKAKPKFIYFPSFIFKLLSSILFPISMISDRVADLVEFLKIAHYYATESMLVWDKQAKEYSSRATPETGRDHLRSFYRRVLRSGINNDKLDSKRLFK